MLRIHIYMNNSNGRADSTDLPIFLQNIHRHMVDHIHQLLHSRHRSFISALLALLPIWDKWSGPCDHIDPNFFSSIRANRVLSSCWPHHVHQTSLAKWQESLAQCHAMRILPAQTAGAFYQTGCGQRSHHTTGAPDRSQDINSSNAQANPDIGSAG